MTCCPCAGGALGKWCSAMYEALLASFVAAGCLVRGLPLFLRRAPRTPLRVLGIIALDTVHRLRRSRPLPRPRVHELALFLDFAGDANAAWDRKGMSTSALLTARRHLEVAGLGACVDEYLRRLAILEGARPAPGGGRGRLADVRAYREGVARLSLETAAAIALASPCSGAALRLVRSDRDVDTLFRILMQCQIIDDVLDYRDDASAGLPSFLTASASLPEALEMARVAAHDYAAAGERSCDRAIFPLHAALRVFSSAAYMIVHVAARHRRPIGQVVHR